MALIGNIIWHIPFLGFINAFFVLCLGFVLTALVVTAPIGIGLIQYAKYLLLPYSYEMIEASEIQESTNSAWQKYSFVIRILYLPFGLVIAFLMLIQIILLCFSVVGIPIAIPLAKSMGVFINPVGKICVERDVATALRMEKAQAKLNSMQNK